VFGQPADLRELGAGLRLSANHVLLTFVRGDTVTPDLVDR
jgi:hypothetical protein